MAGEVSSDLITYFHSSSSFCLSPHSSALHNLHLFLSLHIRLRLSASSLLHFFFSLSPRLLFRCVLTKETSRNRAARPTLSLL